VDSRQYLLFTTRKYNSAVQLGTRRMPTKTNGSDWLTEESGVHRRIGKWVGIRGIDKWIDNADNSVVSFDFFEVAAR